MATATKAARGTKRTCQSSDCGARFYDLGREPIVCPICDSVYALAVSAPPGAAAAAAAARKAPVKEFVTDGMKPDDAPEAEGEEALAEIGDAVEETVAGADDETFLEEEEDAGSDVTNIVNSGDDQEEQ